MYTLYFNLKKFLIKKKKKYIIAFKLLWIQIHSNILMHILDIYNSTFYKVALNIYINYIYKSYLYIVAFIVFILLSIQYSIIYVYNIYYAIDKARTETFFMLDNKVKIFKLRMNNRIDNIYEKLLSDSHKVKNILDGIINEALISVNTTGKIKDD